MPSIRALIVDDEPLARRGIRQLLAPFPDVEVVGECRDGKDALRSLKRLEPDLVFLDVAMPGLDGMDVIRHYGAAHMPVTVFVTAHDEFAVQAFEAQALDYLVKPLGQTRFRATMRRVLERMRLRLPARIAVPTARGELLLDAGEIHWIEAHDDHVRIHAGKDTYRLRATLDSLAKRLGDRFSRVHRTALVQVAQIQELRTGHLLLRDGGAVPVSRRQAARLRAMLKNLR